MSSAGDPPRERTESLAPTLSSTAYEEAESRTGDSESFVSAHDSAATSGPRSAAASPAMLSSPHPGESTLRHSASATPAGLATPHAETAPIGSATPHAEEPATIRGPSASAVAGKTAAAEMAQVTAEASPFSAAPVEPAPIGNVATLSTAVPTPVRTRSSGSAEREKGDSGSSTAADGEGGDHVAIKFGLDHEQETALKALPEEQQEAIRRQIRMDPPRKVGFFELFRFATRFEIFLNVLGSA